MAGFEVSTEGLVVALFLSRFLEPFLFEVGTRDLNVFIWGPTGMAIVAVVAMLVPARRAMSIDPISTLADQ
ncbi:MAG: hypothetical protein IT179_17825 [Acidobacteria bacterium]|nr:hypothetical protein [Acidobacteriota bacterium]